MLTAVATEPQLITRDGEARRLYADAVLAEIPRIIGSLDRNPLRPTYGCFDRNYWHYRTAAFPSEMYQEAVYPLAWAYATRVAGNRWQGCESLRDWVIAALRYSARAAHADGSADDYYPYERALGAAVFSLVACAKTYALLDIEDDEIKSGMVRRARWIASHDESGRLTNHHALAALALVRTARISGDRTLMQPAEARIERVLAWQHPEGWFPEYDGADPGYQTVTIACLAEYRALTGRDDLTAPLHRACEFSRSFLHPDGSYGGAYGSRGTRHCYPHGFELLAPENAAAADLADACLTQLRDGKQASFDDDRLYAHRLVSLCEAYDHFSPTRIVERHSTDDNKRTQRCFPAAGLLVHREGQRHTIISLARGGVFQHFTADQTSVMDCGVVLELTDGQQAITQTHLVEPEASAPGVHAHCHAEANVKITVARTFTAARWETATPLKQAVLHLGMITLGRWCRGLTRRILQKRLIAAQRTLPLHFTRTIELTQSTLRVTDLIELRSPRVSVQRMAYAVDLQAAYTAASAVYQDAVLQPWTDLSAYVEELNRARRVTIMRELPA